MYIRSAYTTPPGYLNLYAHTRFFGKVLDVPGGAAATVWDVQGSLTFNYGANKHIELDVSPIVYQDTNNGHPNGYNVPDDLFLRVKFGNYSATGSAFTFGAQLFSRFPTAGSKPYDHNLPWEPYYAGRVNFGVVGLATYAKDPLYPDDELTVDWNLGYVFHNDVGRKLSSPLGTKEVESTTQEFLYGAGVRIPSEKFNFSIELYGNAFIQSPPKEAFSSNPYVYLTPGITYKAARWLALDFSSDFRLSSTSNDHPTLVKINYPGWRVNLGARWTLLPSSVYRVSEKDILIQKAESRRQLFEQIIKEQRETESAEEELERIKEERRKAEKELERLRQILEGEAKKKPPEQPQEEKPKEEPTKP